MNKNYNKKHNRPILKITARAVKDPVKELAKEPVYYERVIFHITAGDNHYFHAALQSKDEQVYLDTFNTLSELFRAMPTWQYVEIKNFEI